MALKRPEQGKKEQLKTIRDRLYARTPRLEAFPRHELSAAKMASLATAPARNEQETSRTDKPSERSHTTPQLSLTPKRDTIAAYTPSHDTVSMTPSFRSQKGARQRYRTKSIAVAVVFFAVALVLSSVFLFFGQNTISGNNIAIDVHAPFAIGGGDVLSLQVLVTNRNSVAVESATLIVEYPPGTQEADTEGKELFRQRVPLGGLKPGETVNSPVKARIFGEENEEKTVNISIEYRVAGSNATFFKEAEPLTLKISSSPVILSIDAVKEVSSGQEVALTLSLASNSSLPLTDLLVQAEYPLGFDFSESVPKPVKGENVWSIKSLASGGKEQLTLKGVMVGGSAEARAFNFSVGVPSERDRFALASVLTKASTEVMLTNPFAGLTVTTNGSTNKTISVKQSDFVTVSVTFKNTLSDTIYDGTIKVALAGNGLNAHNVDAASGGFYDSSTNTITWDGSGVSGLTELASGGREIVNFTIRGVNPDAAKTPEVSYAVSVSGRRVSESRVPQALTNIESRTIRFESVVAVSSHGLYSIGPFTNTGPMPPKAEAVTQYAIMLSVENGSNELADAAVTTTLPSYVTWSGMTSRGDDITYNPGTREVTWRIGNISAHASVHAAFQVNFLPSVSHISTAAPALVGAQSLRATDRFTGTVVRATADTLTTALPEDPNPAAQAGRVEPK